MSQSRHPLKLPRSVEAAAERLAKAEGVSLHQLIAAAEAEKVCTVGAGRGVSEHRAGDAKPEDLLRFLQGAPDVSPSPEDDR